MHEALPVILASGLARRYAEAAHWQSPENALHLPAFPLLESVDAILQSQVAVLPSGELYYLPHHPMGNPSQDLDYPKQIATPAPMLKEALVIDLEHGPSHLVVGVEVPWLKSFVLLMHGRVFSIRL